MYTGVGIGGCDLHNISLLKYRKKIRGVRQIGYLFSATWSTPSSCFCHTSKRHTGLCVWTLTSKTGVLNFDTSIDHTIWCKILNLYSIMYKQVNTVSCYYTKRVEVTPRSVEMFMPHIKVSVKYQSEYKI